MKKLLLIGTMCIALWACSHKGPVAPVEGRRLVSDVETLEKATSSVELARSKKIENWQMPFQNAKNNRERAAVSSQMKLQETVSIGKGIKSDAHVIAGPIVMERIAYTLDSSFRLQATDVILGEKLWRKELAEIKGTTAKSVGLSAYGNKIYAVSGNGLVIALDLEGKELWRKDLKTALRSAPIIADNRLFVSSVNNELFALDAKTGKKLWSYTGDKSVTNFYGVGNPAISENMVLMPMTNGLINAFDIQTGVLIWTETLWQKRTYNPLLDIPHITASPVIIGDIAYFVGNAGKSGAYRIKDGIPLFTVALGGRETPVISGNVWFMQTNQHELVALDKQNGEQFWKISLNKDRTWYGPVLTDKSLVMTSSKGDLVFFNAKSGQKLRHEVLDSFSMAPVFGANRMLILTADGDLLIYQ